MKTMYSFKVLLLVVCCPLPLQILWGMKKKTEGTSSSPLGENVGELFSTCDFPPLPSSQAKAKSTPHTNIKLNVPSPKDPAYKTLQELHKKRAHQIQNGKRDDAQTMQPELLILQSHLWQKSK